MLQYYLFDGRRLPVGSFQGSLKHLNPVELGVLAGNAAVQASGVPASAIEAVIAGNVIPVDSQSLYLARHIGLKMGIPEKFSALNVNRLCGSGLEAVIQACYEIEHGAGLALALGVESMSQAPYLAANVRAGLRYGDGRMVDLISSTLTDSFIGQPMGRTAETLAQEFSISRQEQDDWAGISQTRAEKAAGILDEIVPVSFTEGKEQKELARDEFVRGAAGLAKLPSLPPAFLEGGTVTAGNSSGINDGASAVLVASEGFVQASGKKPLARILSWASRGCAPGRMGIGPVFAIPAALEKAGLSAADIGLWEINEAFAAQFLAVQKSLKLDSEITNVNGGAVAIGHPLGASGNRILLGLAKEMQRRQVRYGCASLCIGGGQGIAMVIERVP